MNLTNFLFQGIPFVKPVARFEHSEVLDSFDGEIDGTKMAAGCPQPSQSQYTNIEQSEDCLTLDIYMPIVSFIYFFGCNNVQFSLKMKQVKMIYSFGYTEDHSLWELHRSTLDSPK